jgi:hypothetical protein
MCVRMGFPVCHFVCHVVCQKTGTDWVTGEAEASGLAAR